MGNTDDGRQVGISPLGSSHILHLRGLLGFFPCFPERTFYNYEELVEWFNGPLPLEGDVPQLLPHDPTDRSRIKSLLPLQVFSCWNGATIIDAKAFLPPHNIRFRQARNDFDVNGKAMNVTEKASECFLISVDLWKENMGKILTVPKAR